MPAASALSSSHAGGGTDLEHPSHVTSVPYQPDVFRDFVALVGRLFYDDASIVLLDFFAREQKAFTETEMKERLRWREALLHQKLAGLEKQLLVERIFESEKGTKSIQLWRIHAHVFVAVAWRLNTMEGVLQEELRKASNKNDFQCSKSTCGRRVSTLDAAAGPRALEDDHPLCRLCGSPLTTADAEEAKQNAEDRLKRATEQFSPLREALQRVRGMVIPEFTSLEARTIPPIDMSSPEAEPPKTLSLSKGDSGAVPFTTINDSRAIPWFEGGHSTPVSAGGANDGLAASPSEVATRMVFGTQCLSKASSSMLKPASFKVPNSFEVGRGIPENGSRNDSHGLVTNAANTARPQSLVEKPADKSASVVSVKPFSMSLKVKSAEGRGSSTVGSSVVSGMSRIKDNTAKRKGLEIFSASGKKIKL